MKYISTFFCLIIVMGLVFGLRVRNVSAQTSPRPSSSPAVVLTFPIAELGGCDSVESCKAYCDLEENIDACIAYAKEKGFYKEQEGPSEEVLEAAKDELGCTSAEECKAFCSEEANADVCKSFADKHGLKKPEGEDNQGEIMQKAKETLGCSSASECRSFCELEENKTTCQQFAQSVGLNPPGLNKSPRPSGGDATGSGERRGQGMREGSRSGEPRTGTGSGERKSGGMGGQNEQRQMGSGRPRPSGQNNMQPRSSGMRGGPQGQSGQNGQQGTGGQGDAMQRPDQNLQPGVQGASVEISLWDRVRMWFSNLMQ